MLTIHPRAVSVIISKIYGKTTKSGADDVTNRCIGRWEAAMSDVDDRTNVRPMPLNNSHNKHYDSNN